MDIGNRKPESTKPLRRDIKTAGAIRDFKDLEVWKVARELRHESYQLAKALPDIERFSLASQIRRAATSVTANLAEGFGRYGYQENAQSCRLARGSLYELRDHMTTCVDEGYLSTVEGKRLGALAQSVGRLLNGYLRSTLALKQRTDKWPLTSLQFPVSSF